MVSQLRPRSRPGAGLIRQLPHSRYRKLFTVDLRFVKVQGN